MNRENYIKLRNSGEIGNIMFSFYQEACSEQGQTPLDPQNFIAFFNHWQDHNYAVKIVLQFYNKELNVIEVTKENKFLMCI